MLPGDALPMTPLPRARRGGLDGGRPPQARAALALGRVRGEAPSLVEAGWRDTGRVYYNEVRAEVSASFAWLCSATSSMEAPHARAPARPSS